MRPWVSHSTYAGPAKRRLREDDTRQLSGRGLSLKTKRQSPRDSGNSGSDSCHRRDNADTNKNPVSYLNPNSSVPHMESDPLCKSQSRDRFARNRIIETSNAFEVRGIILITSTRIHVSRLILSVIGAHDDMISKIERAAAKTQPRENIRR